MSEPIRDSWGSTAAEREADRPYVSAPFLESFDRDFYESFGRWPTGSPFEGTAPRRTARQSARRDKVAALARHGATEGERRAAEAALERIDAERVEHAERMGRLDDEAYG